MGFCHKFTPIAPAFHAFTGWLQEARRSCESAESHHYQAYLGWSPAFQRVNPLWNNRREATADGGQAYLGSEGVLRQSGAYGTWSSDGAGNKGPLGLRGARNLERLSTCKGVAGPTGTGSTTRPPAKFACPPSAVATGDLFPKGQGWGISLPLPFPPAPTDSNRGSSVVISVNIYCRPTPRRCNRHGTCGRGVGSPTAWREGEARGWEKGVSRTPLSSTGTP